MANYRINSLPVQVNDSVVRQFCDEQGVQLLEGPTVGSDFVEIKTVEPIADETAFMDAIDEALKRFIGRLERLPD